MSTVMYTLVPLARSRILSTTLRSPWLSISRALMVSKPQRTSFLMSSLRRVKGALMPAWMEEFRIKFCRACQPRFFCGLICVIPLRGRCGGMCRGSTPWTRELPNLKTKVLLTHILIYRPLQSNVSH